MSDNTTLNTGSGGDTIATDDIGGVKFPRGKITLGADGVNDGDVSSANPLPIAASALPLPTGAATAANQATIIGHVDGLEGLLTTIDGDTSIIAAAVSGSEMQVDVVTCALPSGAATAAKQPALGTAGTPSSDVITIQGAASMTALQVADNGGSLTVDNNGTFAVQAAQSGTWNITAVASITNALPAGTNNIGDVDVLTVPSDPFGANADAASATGSISAKLRFIASTGIPITGTVTVGSHAVTNAGTFAVQVDGSALTALQLIDDIVYADDGTGFTPATSKVAAVGFLADETATDSVDEGDIGIARMTLDRKQHVVSEVEGATIRESGTALTIKRIKIDAASSGENTLVSAVASKKIRVLSLAIVAAGAVNLYFNNATDGAIFGGSTNKVALTTNSGFVLPHNPGGWFQTGTNNEALRVNLSGAVAVAGSLTYVEV